VISQKPIISGSTRPIVTVYIVDDRYGLFRCLRA